MSSQKNEHQLKEDSFTDDGRHRIAAAQEYGYQSDHKDNNDAPPSTTGPPENIDKKATVNASDLPDDFERKTEFTPVSNDVKKSGGEWFN